jgi:hypothetical protein
MRRSKRHRAFRNEIGRMTTANSVLYTVRLSHLLDIWLLSTLHPPACTYDSWICHGSRSLLALLVVGLLVGQKPVCQCHYSCVVAVLDFPSMLLDGQSSSHITKVDDSRCFERMKGLQVHVKPKAAPQITRRAGHRMLLFLCTRAPHAGVICDAVHKLMNDEP